MTNYNIEIPKYTKLELEIQEERDFFNYMRLLRKAISNYALIIATADTPAGPFFTSAHSTCMMENLGLKINMTNAFRQPYIAVIDSGNIVFEQTLTDLTKPLTFKGNIKNHSISIISTGYNSDSEYWPKARISIDNISYDCIRGYSFLLYNIKDEYIADYSRFETFQDAGHPFHKRPMYTKNILSTFSGGVFCTLELPCFTASNNRSEYEMFIYEMNLRIHELLNKNILKTIWDSKIFNFCNDFRSMEDLKEAISTPESYEDIDGIIKFKDHSSNVVNTRNGLRVTSDQPKKYKRSVFLVGGCTTFGIGSADENTIASSLQRKFNKYATNEEFIVYNYGYFVGLEYMEILEKMIKSLPIKENDIVFLQRLPPLYNLPFCDLSLKANHPLNFGEVFWDRHHYTANGNELIANEIFNFLKERNFFKDANMTIIDHNKSKNESVKTKNENELLKNYKEKLKKFYDENIRPKVGAIVMNANPFTFGHRFLVETALKQCNYLIVFVVEEDKSEIPFNDRIALVKANLADLTNVFVMESGEFIISAKTFSEYFRKESLQEQKIDTSKDVILFAKEIASTLNISVRFAGEEPMDNVTRQYNEDMSKILPQYGIEFVEIKRARTNANEIINASKVRKLAKSKEFEKLKELVPSITLEYLKKKYSIYSVIK